MIAALGMYDMPALQAANDRFWHLIRAALATGPDHLTRDRDGWEIWRSPDLLFAQTCGMPYRTALHGQVQLIGTPDYRLPGCPPGYYCSVLVVRADDPRQTEAAFAGACFAYNEPVSQSGWAAPMTHLRTRDVAVGALRQTGAHAASARAVSDGSADLAGIDALTWELLCTHGGADGLRVLARTSPTPGLPYITSRSQDPQRLAQAVRTAITALSAQDRKALHLHGLVRVPAEAYLSVPTPPPPAA